MSNKKENLLELLEDVFTYEELMNRLETGESPTSFTGGRGKTLREDKFGRIAIRDFFEGNNSSGTFNGEILTKEQFEELAKQDGWEEKFHNNTYNYGGYLEREFDYKLFENDEEDVFVGLYRVHVGLDIRAGYTKYVAIQYDSEYGMLEDLGNQYYIGGAKYTHDGKEFFVSVDATPTSEWLYVYISNSDGNEVLSDETYSLDMYDKDDFVESIKGYLEENNLKFDKESIEVSEY